MKPTLIAIDYGKFSENTWINKSNLKKVEKHLNNGRRYKILEQGDIVIKKKEGFDRFFKFENVTQMRKAIQDESKRVIRDASLKYKHHYMLFSAPTKAGQLLVLKTGGGGRIDRWHDAIDFKGNSPTIEDIKNLYDRVVESGETEFKIIYDCMCTNWETFEDKFSGSYDLLNPSDSDYVQVTLLSTNNSNLKLFINN